jgi:tRNA-Thr(GGU) m(6)t(6)A37 methyltransferase TsaA
MYCVPIGIIHTPHKDPKGTPIQPTGATEFEGVIELEPKYREGLQDLDGFSHIILLYQFHKSKQYNLSVKPYMDTKQRGLFATRYPARPNSIGLSVVRLKKIIENKLFIQDVDMLDGTPLFDIKPFVPAIDNRVDCRIGWLEDKVNRISETKSDGRID